MADIAGFVTIFYCSKDSVGSWDGQIWKITMAVVGWSTYITAGLFLKFKGMDFKGYKYIMGYGYLLFFAFISWPVLDEISYIFVLPLISILVLYKDRNYIKSMMITTLFVLIGSNMYKGLAKGMMEFVSSMDCAMQFVLVICCYACAMMSIKHLIESDGALTNSIEENLPLYVSLQTKTKWVPTMSLKTWYSFRIIMKCSVRELYPPSK